MLMIFFLNRLSSLILRLILILNDW